MSRRSRLISRTMKTVGLAIGMVSVTVIAYPLGMLIGVGVFAWGTSVGTPR